ncbi:MAG: DNA topoisomerase IV [Flavobacteriaceae bacterium]|nr:DNA topoisomerase IV [Flavobacteriaceae bacterium]|tara:strand:+ start:317 stop:709 length:393 start_codon:yes stop_codon:yes gene_type:complete
MVLTKKANLPLLIVLLLSIANCEGIERNCKNFHSGEFYTETLVNGINYKSTFSRNSSNIQIEEFEGKIDSSYVRWVNDCEMILSAVNPKKMSEKKNILIKILTTNDSSYTYEYSYLGQKNKLKAKAIRIR